MKLIIAGGRDYELMRHDIAHLNEIADVTEVVSGCCSGADRCGEEWAKKKGIPVKKMPANWKEHRFAAGPIRNRAMAEYADAVALFPGGSGTRSMHYEAKRAGIVIYDFR